MLAETESDSLTPSSRENGNPRQDVVLENPALYYSAVKKDKHNLRKKVVRHQMILILVEDGVDDHSQICGGLQSCVMQQQHVN